MGNILIKDTQIVNEGKIIPTDLYIKDGKIEKIASSISNIKEDHTEINAYEKYLFPGIIDDQVHFREPGLTHKADIYHESRAAVAGGTTSFMEMPNTSPPALTQQLLEEKYVLGAKNSLANYSFFMGVSNDNHEEVLKTDPKTVCGIKIFMGSSTGNMLVDKENTLKKIFSQSPLLIATHCEDEQTILQNLEKFKKKYGENIPIECHPEIRNEEACYKSSSFAVSLAKKYNTRLHILHISTDKELELFNNTIPLEEKKITSEVCVHHLWFDSFDYDLLGNKIKCNPAIKTFRDKNALLEGLLQDKLDIIATDHAPHALYEKEKPYLHAPAGIPLVQHSLNIMLTFYHQKKITLEKIVEKMCHAPAICFNIEKRGFIREGYWADLSLVDTNVEWNVTKNNIFYKCKWSPFELTQFKGRVTHTFVNGHLAYKDGVFDNTQSGQRLSFDRD